MNRVVPDPVPAGDSFVILASIIAAANAATAVLLGLIVRYERRRQQ